MSVDEFTSSFLKHRSLQMDARLREFRMVLAKDLVDLNQLRLLCFDGIPEEAGLRQTCWKLLLGYLPEETGRWDAVLAENRRLYRQLLSDTIAIPDGSPDDDPLNVAADSKWGVYFKDNEVIAQIDKDVLRTCPDFAFFQTWSSVPRPHPGNSGNQPLHTRVSRAGQDAGPTSEHIIPIPDGIDPQLAEQQWEVIERILFVFAKLNRGIGYVQGMNEILGPLYYTLATDSTNREHAEADAFFCFSALMSEIRNNFIETLDDSDVGVNALMRQLEDKLHDKDPVLSINMKSKGLMPQYYAFRWLSLLLSREFPLPDVISLWDTLFADPCRFNFMLYVAVAMMSNVRDGILKGEFADNVALLQNYPSVDIGLVIRGANDLWRQDILKAQAATSVTICRTPSDPGPQNQKQTLSPEASDSDPPRSERWFSRSVQGSASASPVVEKIGSRARSWLTSFVQTAEHALDSLDAVIDARVGNATGQEAAN